MNAQQFPFLNNLKDYQKRENRQSWSAYYERMRSSFSELINDPEVISEAELALDQYVSKNEYLYIYNDGEIKLRSDSRVNIYPFQNGTYESAKAIPGSRLKYIDPATKKIILHIPGEPPPKVCLMPTSPLNARSINDSMASYLDAPQHYNCVNEILNRQASNFKEACSLTVRHADEKVNCIIEDAVNLDRSHMTIQGPPGTGKTYVGARIILELILQGRRVGVMALSHKAINNLLEAVDDLLEFYQVRGANLVKSKSRDNPKGGFKQIKIGDVVNGIHQTHLVGGTVYSLSRLPGNIIDTLVIDEAGQIPLAWIMAAGRTAKNIVMMGDHKQLPQVSQSMHPEGSGESVLEHLMGDESIIPDDFGVFLDVTRRMNPEITSFVSELMYDGQLKPHESTAKYILDLKEQNHPALCERGLSWIEMNHSGCAQESRQEADEILKIINELKENEYPLDEVLVIAPYRAQEALIRSLLPAEMSESIGTVDRFQGREADIVIFSMTSSDGANLPRDIEFLFSANRLNVALSRARKKAIVLANRKLLTIPVSTLEQLKLVNTLCKLKKICQKKA